MELRDKKEVRNLQDVEKDRDRGPHLQTPSPNRKWGWGATETQRCTEAYTEIETKEETKTETWTETGPLRRAV